MDSELESVIADFNRKWDKGQVEGWTAESSASTSADAGIWCDACRSHRIYIPLTSSQCTIADLRVDGNFAGQRTYAKQTVFDAHLKSKNHLKKAAALEAAGGSKTNGHSAGNAHASTSTSHSLGVNEKARQMALLEHQIRYFVSDYDSPLLVVRNDTKANVERKQALTDKERQIENEELEERERREAEEVAIKAEKAVRNNFRLDAENDSSRGGGGGGGHGGGDDDEEERIYNPLKLPLGWDGKPIPFWLYKLHGLGVEYSCEICSNFTYRGRKNFERHFQEARHAFGMRALGLPNTKHFHEITKIADAVACEFGAFFENFIRTCRSPLLIMYYVPISIHLLIPNPPHLVDNARTHTVAEKLKNEGRQEVVAQETMEEVEDEEGNVYNRKTYEDLKRQGLI
jgi:splicing factor 3A subunit 3